MPEADRCSPVRLSAADNPTLSNVVSSIERNDALPGWRTTRSLGLWAVVSLTLCLVSGRSQEDETFSNLLANSPFGPAVSAEEASQADVPTVGFRGYYHAEGEWFFNVVPGDSTSEQRGAWIGIGEPNGELLVKSFDLQAETVEVKHRGRNWTLHLMKARIQRLSAPNEAAASEEPMVSAREQERLKKIAEEIRRRRAARREAAATGNNRPRN